MSKNLAIEESSNAVRKLWDQHGVQNPLRFVGFCLSLLPIPGIQQAGASLEKHLSDKEFQSELNQVWDAIRETNEKVESIENVEEAIVEIAETVNGSPDLLKLSENFSSYLHSQESSFSMETDDHSYQELVNSLVQAGRVLISATNQSTNVIENTKVESPSTHLHASGGSRNYVDNTSFTDQGHSVGMQGISTEGDIHVTGNSQGFGRSGGTLNFGGNPNLVSGNCPNCSQKIQLDKRQLLGHDRIQCPHCNHVSVFSVA